MSSPQPAAESGPDQGSDYESADEATVGRLNTSEDNVIRARGAASDTDSDGDDVGGAMTPPEHTPSPRNTVPSDDSSLEIATEATSIVESGSSVDDVHERASAGKDDENGSVGAQTPTPPTLQEKPAADSEKCDSGEEQEGRSLEAEVEEMEGKEEEERKVLEDVDTSSLQQEVVAESSNVEYGPEEEGADLDKEVGLSLEAEVTAMEELEEEEREALEEEVKRNETNESAPPEPEGDSVLSLEQDMTQLKVDDRSDQSDGEPPELIASTEHDSGFELSGLAGVTRPKPEGSAVDYGSDVQEDDADADEESNDVQEGERQKGDGQEQQEEEVEPDEPDDDEDIKNPAFIPRMGQFYQHDSRDQTQQAVEEKPGRSDLVKKWPHDKFREEEQAPKTKSELEYHYGFDIRDEDKPPEGDVKPRNQGRPSSERKSFGDGNRPNDRRKPREDQHRRDTQPEYKHKEEEFPSLGATAPPKKLAGIGRGQAREPKQANARRNEGAPRGGFSEPRENRGYQQRRNDNRAQGYQVDENKREDRGDQYNKPEQRNDSGRERRGGGFDGDKERGVDRRAGEGYGRDNRRDGQNYPTNDYHRGNRRDERHDLGGDRQDYGSDNKRHEERNYGTYNKKQERRDYGRDNRSDERYESGRDNRREEKYDSGRDNRREERQNYGRDNRQDFGREDRRAGGQDRRENDYNRQRNGEESSRGGRGGFDRRDEQNRGPVRTMEFRRSRDNGNPDGNRFGSEQEQWREAGQHTSRGGYSRGGYASSRQQRTDESGDIRMSYGHAQSTEARRNTSPPARGAKRYSAQRQQQTNAGAAVPAAGPPLDVVVQEMPRHQAHYDYPNVQRPPYYQPRFVPPPGMYGHGDGLPPQAGYNEPRFVVPQGPPQVPPQGPPQAAMYSGQMSSPNAPPFIPHTPIMPYEQAVFYDHQNRMGAVPSMRQQPMHQARSKAIPIVDPQRDGFRAPPPSPPPQEPIN